MEGDKQYLVPSHYTCISGSTPRDFTNVSRFQHYCKQFMSAGADSRLFPKHISSSHEVRNYSHWTRGMRHYYAFLPIVATPANDPDWGERCSNLGAASVAYSA